MATKSAQTPELSLGEVSAGVALALITGLPAEAFEKLGPVAQAAVVARIVPEAVRCLDAEGAEAVLAVTQRAMNVLAATQDVALAACVRAEELAVAELAGDGSDGERHRPDALHVVASAVSPMLCATPRGMVARVARAVRVVEELPRTLAAALAGVLDGRQVAIVADVAASVDVAAVGLYDRAVEASQVGALTPGRFRRACERAAFAVDPGAGQRRAEGALRDRFVKVEPGLDPGMALWTAALPAADSARAWGAVDELAHEYVRADSGRPIDQARADAFLDLVLGQAQVTTTVELVVPVFTRPGAAGLPGCAPVTPSTGSGLPAPRASGPPAPPASRSPSAPPASGPPAPPASVAGATPGSMTLDRLGLADVEGPPLASLYAIGSELWGGGCRELDGLPEQAAAKLLVVQQLERARAEWSALSAHLLEACGLTLGPWRPPEVGVRDPKVGWILSAALVGVLTDPDVRVRITVADALTGVTLARDPRSYRPNAALAQRIRDRDRTCRFPGCGVSAKRADIDHVVPFPDGRSHEGNLLCLCRSHHGFKHHARWTVELASDGTCVWTSPTGRRYTTTPADVRLDAA